MDIKQALSVISSHPDYKILQRVAERQYMAEPDKITKPFIIAVLDTETSDLDVSTGEVIELGCIKAIGCLESGRIGKIVDRLSMLEQPSKPLTTENIRVHGITNEMLEGQFFDEKKVIDFFDDVDMVIAHNSSFDRPFVEKRFKDFPLIPWTCSLKDIPWVDFDYEGSKLGALLNQSGFFHEAHRAVEDCNALLYLIALPLKNSTTRPLSLLTSSLQERFMIVSAERADFDKKDILKSNGFRWVADDKVWEKEIKGSEKDSLIEFLSKSVYPSRTTFNIGIREFKPTERYSAIRPAKKIEQISIVNSLGEKPKTQNQNQNFAM